MRLLSTYVAVVALWSSLASAVVSHRSFDADDFEAPDQPIVRSRRSDKSDFRSYPITHEPGEQPYNLLEPLQQRLAYKDAWSMSVSWNT